MPALTATFLTALLVTATPPATSARPVQPDAAPRVLRSDLQQQADLLVHCSGQRTLPDRLTTAQRAAASRTAAELRAGQIETAMATWQSLISGIKTNGVPGAMNDIEPLIWWVVGNAILASEDSPDAHPVVPGATRSMRAQELQEYISNMEKRPTSVGDDAQRANVDLQKTLQTRQMMLQIMSNIAKSLYDTAMAIVRNLRGPDPAIRTSLLGMQEILPATARPKLEAALRSYATSASNEDIGAAGARAQACVGVQFPAATPVQVELLSALLLFEFDQQERMVIDDLEAGLQRAHDALQLVEAQIRSMEDVAQERDLKWRPAGTTRITRPPSKGLGHSYTREQFRLMEDEELRDRYAQRQEEMQDMGMSFNMQYLGLQQKMQDESRRLTVMSNIMKTKHSGARNAIKNLR